MPATNIASPNNPSLESGTVFGVEYPLQPPALAENRYGVAVIIGNKTYKGRTPAVEFAHNDADAMKRFVVERQLISRFAYHSP